MVTIPSTNDYWYDQTFQTVPEVVDNVDRPLFMAMFSSNKGPVGWRKIHGEDFFKLYGADISFEKHGQPLLQAAYIIANGGELLCNRLVADDSSVANTIILATVKQNKTQKSNGTGDPLYIDNKTGQETLNATDEDGTPNEVAYINTATIKWSAKTVSDVTDYEGDILPKLPAEVAENDETMEYTYPIFTVTDIGPGASTKRFRIDTNYTLSRSMGFAIHQLIYCGSQNFDYEYANFSSIPGMTYNGKSLSAQVVSNDLIQLRCYECEDGINKLIERLTAITGVSESTLMTYDLLFANDIRGKSLSLIDIDPDGLDLSAEIGIPLSSGSDGEFGDSPFGTTAYENAMIKALDEYVNPEIYDLDRYQIDACVDANYPKSVKKLLVDLAAFRKDFFYFADYGTKCNSVDAVIDYKTELPTGENDHRFSAWYYQHGHIVDPYTSKFVDVTLTYGIARVLCIHLSGSQHKPVCGIVNGFTFPEFIDINHIPVKTRTVNQKEMLIEMQVNYASMINDVLTLETEYTAQGALSALSYINNVTALQTIIKDIRQNCPKFRYSFTVTGDVNVYEKNVNDILKKYKSDYKELAVEFGQDELMKQNKLFEVNLKVVHADFYQAERINVYTMSIIS